MPAARAFIVERLHALADHGADVFAGGDRPAALCWAFVLGERDPAAAGQSEVVVRRGLEVDLCSFVGVRLDLGGLNQRRLATQLAIAIRLARTEVVRGGTAAAA